MNRIFFSALAAIVIALPLSSAQQPEKFDAAKFGRGYVPLTPARRAQLQAISHAKHGDKISRIAKFQALPAAFDCRTKNPLPMWDQGPCGSCYLIATVRTWTSGLVDKGWGKADNSLMLSQQYGMDRPRNFGGCNGGNGTKVADWIVENGWIAETYVDLQGVVHDDYPSYTASTGSDRTKPGAKVWLKGADWGFVNANGSPTYEEIKAAMVNYGRLNIALDAGGQFGNGTGTITSMGSSIDHEINAVAYDDNKDGGAILLENQWGTGWGNGGYRWVTKNAARNIVDWFYVVVPSGPTPPTPPLPPIPPIPPIGTFVITPATVTLLPKGIQQFTTTPPADFWISKGGVVDQTGKYTAPDAPGTYTVGAISLQPFGAASASVTVSTTPPPPTGPTIVVGADLKAGTYRLVPLDTETVPLGTRAELERIKGVLNRLLPNVEDVAPTKPQPKIIETPEPEQVQAKPMPVIQVKDPLSYEAAHAQALKSKLPLVVGVGVSAPTGKWVSVETPVPFNGWKYRTVIIFVPRAGDLLTLCDVPPAEATAARITAELSKSN